MEGYAKIASLMSHHRELAIFRRFGIFNLQNLLYLQAELTHLEGDLKELVEKDQADPSRLFYTKHWYSLAHSEGDEEKEQWDKVLQIREKLKEYSRGRFLSTTRLHRQCLRSYDCWQWRKLGTFWILIA
jgi:hypothetical protein